MESTVKVFDAKNNKWYYMEKEFLEHPGIADGTVSDLDLLAAVCDAEAGDRGLVGMEAVALCVLNCRSGTSIRDFRHRSVMWYIRENRTSMQL